MQPGIYHGITADDYHGGAGINKSLLDIVHVSPLHARYVLGGAENARRPSLATRRTGTAFHAVTLEPDAFAREFVRGEKFDRRTKAGKEGAEAFDAANAGKTVLDPDEWALIHAMRDSVMSHPAAGALLSGIGCAEASMYWTDPETGLLLRARPDWWRNDGVMVDLKSTDDASPEAFARSVANYRYHVQAQHYTTGADALGVKRGPFVFVAVEKKPPYAVGVYTLDGLSLEVAAIEWRADLDTLAECMRSGVWPGYGDEIQSLSLPSWALRVANDNDELSISYA